MNRHRSATATAESSQHEIRAVLFDFSGTLFAIESAEDALRAALGEAYVHRAAALARAGAINGSSEPADLPDHLAEVWQRRDLSHVAHRAAYSGLSVHAGLTRDEADAVYDRGVTPQAWRPFPDTVRVLRRLHDAGVPTAVVSNIGWDPRPVLDHHSVIGYLDHLVLSDERGVMKPDPAIFRLACQDVATEPAACLMVGDNPTADGAATQLGIHFELVDPDPATRAEDALERATTTVRR